MVSTGLRFFLKNGFSSQYRSTGSTDALFKEDSFCNNRPLVGNWIFTATTGFA